MARSNGSRSLGARSFGLKSLDGCRLPFAHPAQGYVDAIVMFKAL